MAISKRLRYEILRRDNHTCRYCGAKAPDVELEVDHVIPRTLGGADEPGNLVTSCTDCNAGKSSVPADAEIVEDVSQDALRWSEAMRQAAEIGRRRKAELQEAIADYDSAWRSTWNPVEVWASVEPDAGWHYSSDPERKYPVVIYHYNVVTGEEWSGRLYDSEEEAQRAIDAHYAQAIPPRPKDWEKDARQLITAGLTPDDFESIVEEVKSDRDYISWDRKWAYTRGCCWGQVRERQAVARALLASEEKPGSPL